MNRPYHGILGLGFQELSGTFAKTPINNLLEQRGISRAIFAFKLTKAGSGKASQLTIGGYDPSDYVGELKWIPKTSPSPYWDIPIDSVAIRNNIMNLHQSAIIDSGTSLIVCPEAAAISINAMLGGTRLGASIWTVACESIGRLPDITLSLGGSSFTLTPDDYILRWGSTCYSGFSMLVLPPGMPQWIIGAIFLRKHYSVFDQDKRRIGLALTR